MTQEEFAKRSEPKASGEEAWIGKLRIQNVLCPVDFSDFSRRAFRYALALARRFQARLILQHTLQLPTALFLEGTDPMAGSPSVQKARQEAKKNLQDLLKEGPADPGEISLLLNDGDIRQRILETIAERKIDLVVIGTHGRKGFNRLMLGSVAEHIIHEAICPVLVISRPQTDFAPSFPDEPIQLKTILLATDFSPNSGRALTYALRWASEWEGKVILFHVIETIPPARNETLDLLPEYNPNFEKQLAESWTRIQQLVPQGIQRRCEVICEVRQGKAKEEILKVAEEKHADLIIMGARGMGRSAIVWGSTISGVVRDGRFPVLAVRHLVD
ncbi:MAG: universal stress protein [Acidobacteria bacterium]|nr:universal stress protein [Acidobacteriota bacterium]